MIDTLTAQTSFISTSNRLVVILNSSWGKQDYSRLVAAFAVRGPAMIVAGSDWVPGYSMVREIRRQTKNVKQTLDRLNLARAFTCYQVLDLLEHLPAEGIPLLIMDFFHTFYDQDIPMDVRMRVMKKCIGHLHRSAGSRPVAAIIRFAPVPVYSQFLAVLKGIADDIFEAVSDVKPGIQPLLIRGG